MELRTLSLFLAVAQELSVTKAAARMYISQPALTRRIHALEEECGSALFVRTKHGLLLTEAGLLLRARAQEMLEFADKTLKDLRGSKEKLQGTIAVGMGELKASKLLCSCLADFCRENPQVNFEIFTAIADDARIRLERGTLDFALMLRPVPQDAYHSVDLTDDEELVVLLRTDDPLAVKPCLTVSDLKGRRLILPAREAVRSELTAFYDDPVFSSKAQLSNLSANAALMVQSGAGLAVVCCDGYSYTGLADITVRSLSPAVYLGTALVWKRRGVQSKAAQAFIKFLHARKLSLGVQK